MTDTTCGGLRAATTSRQRLNSTRPPPKPPAKLAPAAPASSRTWPSAKPALLPTVPMGPPQGPGGRDEDSGGHRRRRSAIADKRLPSAQAASPGCRAFQTPYAPPAGASSPYLRRPLWLLLDRDGVKRHFPYSTQQS